MTTVVTFNRFPTVGPIPSHDPLAAFYKLMEPLGEGEEYGIVGIEAEGEEEEEEEEWECPCMGGLSYCWRCDAPDCGCWEPDCTTCSNEEEESIELWDEERQWDWELTAEPAPGEDGDVPF